MDHRLKLAAAALFCCMIFLSAAAQSGELKTYKVEIRNHAFIPAAFDVPAGERFRIEVTSRDETPDELESYDMKFEKIVVPNATVTVFAGPLKPGTYTFLDDYHPDTKGTVTAVEKKD